MSWLLPRMFGAAARDLRLRPGQSILTGASLLVGILAVVAIYTASAIVRDIFVAQEEQAHGRAVTMQADMSLPHTSVTAIEGLAVALDRQLDPSGVRYAVTARQAGQLVPTMLEGQQPVAVGIDWLYGDLPAVRRLPMTHGRWLKPSDQQYPAELVLNERARAMLPAGIRTLRIGGPLTPDGLTVAVVGTVNDGADEPIVYGNLMTALEIAPSLVVEAQVSVQAHLPDAEEGALGEAMELAVERSGAELIDRPRRADRVDELQQTLGNVQLAFLVCALVALFVSSLGILNIGLASVRQRSRELLIRRAVGADRGDLVALVLVAALYVACIATVVGVGLAVLAVEYVVPGTLPAGSALAAPSFPWSAAVAGGGAAVVTTLLGAVAPAVVAARLDVADALRG